MFRIITIAILVTTCNLSIAQNPSAVFELESTDQGVLIPRTDTATVNAAYPTPATGLLIFQNSDASFYVYDGTKWKPVGNGSGSLDLSHTSNNTERTIAISGGGASTTIDVADGDNDAINEIQGIGSVLDTDNDAGFRRIRRVGSAVDGSDAVNKNYADLRATPWQKLSGFIRYESPVILGKANDPKATLHVDGNDDVLFGKDTIGVGKKFIWNASQGALRAGDAGSEDSWDPINIGLNSTAFGDDNLADGTSSMSWGQGNRATGLRATVWGRNNEVPGFTATCAGGNNNTVSGTNSMGWGLGNSIAGGWATGWGTRNNAQSVGSTIWGQDNWALSYLETILGAYADTLSHSNPFTWEDDDYLFVIGNGTSSTNRNNALTIFKSGIVDIDSSLNASRIFVSGAPVQDLEVATKNYVDNSSFWSKTGKDTIAYNGNVSIGEALSVAGSDSLDTPDLTIGSGPTFDGPVRLVLKRESTVFNSGDTLAKISFNGRGETFNNQGPLEKTGAFIQAVQKGDWRHGDVDRAATSLNFHIQDDSFGSSLDSPVMELEADQTKINTFTKLGNDAPAIKILKETTTISSTAVGGTASVTVDVPYNKIISINVVVQDGFLIIPPSYTLSIGKRYQWFGNSINTNQTRVTIQNQDAADLSGDTALVTVMYEK